MAERLELRNNPDEKRYEAQLGEHIAVAAYFPGPSILTFTHTEVPEALEGQGTGSALIRYALEDVRARGLKIAPLCPFVAAFIRRHPEYRELVYPRFLYMVS